MNQELKDKLLTRQILEATQAAQPLVQKTIDALADLEKLVGDQAQSLRPAIWVLCQASDEIAEVEKVAGSFTYDGPTGPDSYL